MSRVRVSNVARAGLGQEDQADDEGHQGDHDRVPEAGEHIAGRRHNGEGRRGQEDTEPAVAQMVGQGMTFFLLGVIGRGVARDVVADAVLIKILPGLSQVFLPV